MSFEKALREELDNVLPAAVYPLIAPKGVDAPYIIYTSSYGNRDHVLDGHLTSREIEVGIHIVTKTYAQLKQLSNTAMDNLLALSGQTMGSDLVPVQSVSYDDEPQEAVDPATYEYYSFLQLTFRI